MTYQEKSIAVSLTSYILILSFYLIKVFQIIQVGNIYSKNVFSLWGTIIVLVIIINIVGNILTHIVFSIIHAIKTGEEESSVEDERDKLIALKGTRIAYFVFSIGVFLSMLSLVIGKPPLVMFNLLIFFGIVAEIIADIARLYLYRRGF